MLDTKIIGNKIAEARKRVNISQAQLAQRLYISSQAVGKWERGESMPDITTFIRLAEILGVDLNYFSESFQPEATDNKPFEPIAEQSLESPTVKPKRKLSWDMSRGNWVNADFSGLNNLHEKFSASNMQKCKFIDSDLSGLILSANNVDHCDFSDSDIRSSQIKSSSLASNKFTNCLLQESRFSESSIVDCDFTGADFTGVKFKNSSFVKNIMENAVLNHTSFTGTSIDDVVFDGTIDDCYFENCSFKKVTFKNAKLINNFFKNRSLKGIKFIDCQADRMTYEFLKNGKADLSGITMF